VSALGSESCLQRCFAAVFALLLLLPSIRAASSSNEWNIVWSDEFSGTTINTNHWTFDLGDGSAAGIPGWGNNELQYYTSRNVNAYVASGMLNIVAQKESLAGKQYTSARLKTAGLFSKKYGRFEFRAKLPTGVGFWPALWMMPQDPVYGGWPASGEIDVLENKGQQPNLVQGTIHFGSSSSRASATKTYNLPGGGSVTNFHTYLIEWTTNSFTWFVDGVAYQTQTNWWTSRNGVTAPYPAPFDQPFYLIMNLAIGGNYLGNPSVDSINNNGAWPGVMQVDYVRVYERTAPLRVSATPTDAAVLLTWPSNIVCRLQTSEDPEAAESSWTDVLSLTGQYTLHPTNPRAFFRLASP
jgi:beta-glucanase (GH16 family)